MNLLDDDALVLDHHPYRDRDLILAVLTHKAGVQRGVLRRARGGKAPPAAAAQILSLVQVSLYHRPQAELATFQHLELINSSFPLAAELSKSAASMVVAELLLTYCPPGEPSERLFRLGVAALEALLAGADANSVVAYAEFWILTLGGVLPASEDLASILPPESMDYLSICRRRPIAALPESVPSQVAGWLDGRVRDEAERPLRALSFFRQHAR